MADDHPESLRHRGRPRVEEPSLRVSTWLKEHEYDRLVRLANRNDCTVSAVMRQLLVLRLK